MGAATRDCPECGRRWKPRDARFCGVCGASLRAAPRTDAATVAGVRRRAAVRASAGVALLTAVVVATQTGTLDLRLADPVDRGRIDVRDPDFADSPLTAEQETALRAEAHPDRLRCEPRPCEGWRVARPRAGQVALGGGIVPIDDDLILLLGNTTTIGDGDDTQPARTIIAVDPDAGTTRWQRTVVTTEGQGGAGGWAQLEAGPHGALLLSDGAITALDRDAEVVWRWHPTSPHGLRHNVWRAVEIGGSVLVAGEIPGQPGDRSFVAALDTDTGMPRWTHHAREVALLDHDAVVVLGADGDLRALDPADGEVRWTHPVDAGEGLLQRAGPWIAHRRARGGHELLDPRSGEVAGVLDGYLVSLAVGHDGRLVAIVAGTVADELARSRGGAELGIVALDPSGETAWRVRLGEMDPWWHCCDIDVGEQTVTVVSVRFHREFDATSGELVAAEPVTDHARSIVEPTRRRADWFATPREDLVVAWHNDGNGLDLRTGAGVVTVRGTGGIGLESFDPVVVSDGAHVLGIQLPDDADTDR